jgi:hypothetical protein
VSKYEPARLGERLLDACIGLVLAAFALYAAVWLVQQVWMWLVGAGLVVLAGLLTLGWWRRW